MTNLARFTINGSASSPGGFDATNGQVLALALEASSSLVQRATFEVYTAADSASPLASKGAPALSLVGASTGAKVDAATPASSVAVTMPASGAHSYIVRCSVNGGLDAYGDPNPDLVFERMVAIRAGVRRKIVPSEGTQYEAGGWAGAQNDDVDAPGGGSGYTTVQDEGVSRPQRTTIDFQGPGVSATDSGGKTVVTIAGAAGGGGMGFPFTYAGSGSVADADPGAGIFRGNNATLANSALLFVDDLSSGGAAVAAWLAKFDDLAGTPKGTLRIQSQSDSTKWLEFLVTGITVASGYTKVAVTAPAVGPGGLLTTAGDTFISFDSSSIPQDLNNQGLKSARYIAFNGIVAITPTTGAVTIDPTAGQRQQISLTGAVSVTLGTPPGPMSLEVTWVQDATGGRTVSFVTTVNGDVPPISTVGSDATATVLDWDGTSWNWNYNLIRNPDVATGAAIAGSKIAPDFGSQVVQTTGSFQTAGFIGVGSGTRAGSGQVRADNNFALWGRNTAGSLDTPLVFWDGTIPKLTLGSGNTGGLTAFIEITTSALLLRVGTNVQMSVFSGALQFNTNKVGWAASVVTAPLLTQDDNSAGSGVGQKMTGRAQSCIGATSTGGAMDWGPGAGSTAGGLGRWMAGGTTPGGGAVRFSFNDTGWATDGVTPIAQPARVGQLTDSTTGSGSSTVGDVGAAFSQSTLNNIHASLLNRINGLEAIIHNRGISA